MKDMAEAAAVLHNLLRQSYPGITAHEADHEAKNDNVVPGT